MTTFVDRAALRTAWYPVAESTDISDRPHAARLLGENLVLWRSRDGELVAAPDVCPHRQAPLSIGTYNQGHLTCAYHGWTFGTQGRCTLVPSSGPGAPIPPTAHLNCYQTQERYGLVWVCPGDPAVAIPRIPRTKTPHFAG